MYDKQSPQQSTRGKSMSEIKFFKYTVEIFNEPIYVVIGDREAVVAWGKRNFGLQLNASDHCNGMHWCLYGGPKLGYAHVIWLLQWDGSMGQTGTLLHEIMHYVAETLSNHHIPMAPEVDGKVQSEFLAYFVAQIFQELMTKILKGMDRDCKKTPKSGSKKGRNEAVDKKCGKKDVAEEDEADVA